MSLTFEGDGTITGFDAGLSGFGGLVAVSSTIGTPTHTTTSATPTDVGLSVTHTPASASNTLLVSAFGLLTNSNTAVLGTVAYLVRDSTTIAIQSVSGTGEYGGSVSFFVQDSPATTSPVTYKIQIAKFGNTGYWGRYNTNATAHESSIVVMEVSV